MLFGCNATVSTVVGSNDLKYLVDLAFVLRLTAPGMRAFGSADTMKKWTPHMLTHQHVILSSPLLASTWLDMNDGCSGPSRHTAMLRAEILAMLTQRLSCQDTLADETTLIIILHLLAGEMWICDEGLIRVHKEGILKFIVQQGGLDNLSNAALAEVAAS